jgi:hypothetical protein
VLGSAAPMAAVGGCCPPVVPAAPAVGPAPASRAAISLVRLSISVVHGPAAAAPTGRTSRAHAPNRNAMVFMTFFSLSPSERARHSKSEISSILCHPQVRRRHNLATNDARIRGRKVAGLER